MPLILGLFFITYFTFAAEVATLEINQNNRNEITLVFTDNNTQTALEKAFLAQPCKPKLFLLTSGLRGNQLPRACRALMVKFLLDNGYKPIDERTFSRP